MTAEQTVAAYVEAFNSSDVAALAALYAPETDFVNPFSPHPLRTREAVHVFVASMFAAYDEMAAEVDDLVVSGDRAAARLHVTARHTGKLAGPRGEVAASGRTVELRTAEFFHIDAAGLIVEHIRIFDTAAALAQLES
jgi:steroid delta-isomerase-like uncharacterized protein